MNDRSTKVLSSLVQLDFDAVLAYTRAIDGVEPAHASIRERLIAFRADHERHIQELSAAIVRMGGEAPRKGRDFKGVLIEGMTAVQSAFGTEGALRAMVSNEKLTNARYDAALNEPLPDDVIALVAANRDDERRHLAYVQEALDSRLWERLEAAATGP